MSRLTITTNVFLAPVVVTAIDVFCRVRGLSHTADIETDGTISVLTVCVAGHEEAIEAFHTFWETATARLAAI